MTVRVSLSLLLMVSRVLPAGDGSLAAQQEPPARAHAAMAFDPALERLVLTGGGTRTSTGWITFDDLWTRAGETWQRGSHGVARTGHKLVYHEPARAIVAIGGNSGNEWPGEVPGFVEGSWVPKLERLSPRTEAAAAYDAARRRLVVFGGILDRTPLGTTLEHDGERWIQVSDSGPAPRHSASMAFHAATGRIVLFGGSGVGGAMFGDTWTWDGTRWTLSDSSGPGPLMGAAIAADEARNELVLFGGVGSAGLSGRTWTWNGTTWRERQVPGPSPRIVAAMAYDPVRQVLVLFGGRTEGMVDSSETWEWNGSGWMLKK